MPDLITSINGTPAPWTEEIWKLWYTFADTADPKFSQAKVERANYYTPRPKVDQYNCGSEYEGFTYVLIGDDGHKHVWQVQWKGTNDRAPLCPDCKRNHWPFYGCFVPRARGAEHA